MESILDSPMGLGAGVGVIVILPAIFLVYYIAKKKGKHAADKFTFIYGISMALLIGLMFFIASKIH